MTMYNMARDNVCLSLDTAKEMVISGTQKGESLDQEHMVTATL